VLSVLIGSLQPWQQPITCLMSVRGHGPLSPEAAIPSLFLPTVTLGFWPFGLELASVLIVGIAAPGNSGPKPVRVHDMNAILGLRGLVSPKPSESERSYLTEDSYGVQSSRSSLLPVPSYRWYNISHHRFLRPLEKNVPMIPGCILLNSGVLDWSIL
jgi:hypothetical protein